MDTPAGFRQSERKQEPGRMAGSRPQFIPDMSSTQTYAASPQAFNPNYSQQQYGPYSASFDQSQSHFHNQQFSGQSVFDPSYADHQLTGQQLINDPMISTMAMHYGSSLADQGKDYVHKNLEKYVALSKLKYYFSVDTTYVLKKMALLVFPYAHTNWCVRYNHDTPASPRYDVSAPDLYIPVMAFVTYVLVAGVVLGTQNRFSPEQLGIQASTALVWVIVELLITLLATYIMSLSTNLSYADVLAYSGYKFVGMVLSLLSGIAFSSTGYYIALAWLSAAMVFFLTRTLRYRMMPAVDTDDSASSSTKHALYVILCIAVAQPLLMWWLTSEVMLGRRF